MDNDYQCRCCNAAIHWFCSVDATKVKEPRHGAHYTCPACDKANKYSQHWEKEGDRQPFDADIQVNTAAVTAGGSQVECKESLLERNMSYQKL
jgi:hypothetical protein